MPIKLPSRRLTSCLLILCLFLLALGPTAVSSAPVADPSVWSLVWQDEFNGANGSPIDGTKWTAEVGGWGWGNNELESYTSRIDNAFQNNGALTIKAVKEHFTGSDNITREFTSARLISKNKFSATFGRFEARVKIPFGQGIWPAFWMLGNDIDSAGWPNCGEVDIMENIGREPNIIHGTIHGPGYSGANGITSSYTLPDNQPFANAFHTYTVEWEPNVVRFYCDGILYRTTTPANLPPGKTWVFDHPFFILMNVAVGGDWPGSPDTTTSFPQTMQVDYVRVYQRSTPSNTPLILRTDNANEPLALESVWLLKDPFTVSSTKNLSPDQRTRLVLLVANLDLIPGDDATLVSATARDGQGNQIPLTVESVRRVPSFDWITQVVVKLPDAVANVNQAQVSVTARGHTSNEVPIHLVAGP